MTLRSLIARLLESGIDLDHAIVVRRITRDHQGNVLRSQRIAVARVSDKGAIVIEDRDLWTVED